MQSGFGRRPVRPTRIAWRLDRIRSILKLQKNSHEKHKKARKAGQRTRGKGWFARTEEINSLVARHACFCMFSCSLWFHRFHSEFYSCSWRPLVERSIGSIESGNPMDENFPKRRRWFQFRLRTPLIALGCLILVVAMIRGIRNGRIGILIREIQGLQAPSEQRNRQIDELVNP